MSLIDETVRCAMKQLSQNLVGLINFLSDEACHDGTSIGNHLNISRAAVWKLVKKLTQYGVPLVSTKGKGYQLQSPLILLDSQVIRSRIRHKSVELIVLEKTASTNDCLKQLAQNNTSILACLSEYQSAGKGRLERHWHSPFAKNIYLSVLCPFEKDISELSGLGLVSSLAICHAIEAATDLGKNQLSVKWPNDILFNGEKLGGVLIEIQAESNGFCQVIIGMGLNVNMRKAFKRDVNQPWTSLANMLGTYINRHHLAVEIIDTLIDYLERFSAKGLAAFKQEWKRRDALLGTKISVISRQRTRTGMYQGINNQGHLKLSVGGNEVMMLSAGDTSIVK